jgi:hypothetical protein
MRHRDELITCALCGTRYTEAEGRVCRADCPLHRTCGLLSCPYCAHEVAPRSRLTRWLTRWLTKPQGTGSEMAADESSPVETKDD